MEQVDALMGVVLSFLGRDGYVVINSGGQHVPCRHNNSLRIPKSKITLAVILKFISCIILSPVI